MLSLKPLVQLVSVWPWVPEEGQRAGIPGTVTMIVPEGQEAGCFIWVDGGSLSEPLNPNLPTHHTN